MFNAKETIIDDCFDFLMKNKVEYGIYPVPGICIYHEYVKFCLQNKRSPTFNSNWFAGIKAYGIPYVSKFMPSTLKVKCVRMQFYFINKQEWMPKDLDTVNDYIDTYRFIHLKYKGLNKKNVTYETRIKTLKKKIKKEEID